jgi:transposase
MQPAPWQPQPKEIRQLRALVRRLERGRMSKMGRRALRKAFFMPALVALKHNPLLIDMKARLTVAGKPKMAIVGAAMRKLIHIVYGVLKHKTPFNPLLTAQNA